MVSEIPPSIAGKLELSCHFWYIVAELSQLVTGLFSHMHSVIRELLGKILSGAGRATPRARRDRGRLCTPWCWGQGRAWAAWDPGRGCGELGLCKTWGLSGQEGSAESALGNGHSLGKCLQCWETPQTERDWMNIFLAQELCSSMHLNFASWMWGSNMSYFLFNLGAAALSGKSWAKCWMDESCATSLHFSAWVLWDLSAYTGEWSE